MHRVATLEQLQIPLDQVEFPYAVSATLQHMLDVIEVLLAGFANVGNVFEHATALGLLDQDRHGEFVAIEVPRKVVAGLHDAIWIASQWIGPLIDRLGNA